MLLQQCGRIVPGEPTESFATGFGQLQAQIVILYKERDVCGERSRIPGLREEAGHLVLNVLSNAAAVGGDDGTTSGGGFGRGQGKSFGPTRGQEH